MNRSPLRLLMALGLVCLALVLISGGSLTAQEGASPTPPPPQPANMGASISDAPTSDSLDDPYPADVLPYVEPIPLPLLPIAEAYKPLITDEQYLSAFGLDVEVVQQKLVETGSVLSVSQLIFDDGGMLPAAEAISTWSSLYTLSPAVLLTVAELEHGLLSRTAQTPLTEAEIISLSNWFPQTALSLATHFYEVYNSETEIIRTAGIDASGNDYVNGGSYAVSSVIGGVTPFSSADESPQVAFTRVFTAYFGSPVVGDTYVDHPESEPLNSESRERDQSLAATPEIVASPSPAQVLGASRYSLFRFPWTANDPWNFNSGPHRPGGPGTQPATFSGLDFQPGSMDDCDPNVAESRYVIAGASGLVVQNQLYSVLLDHDFDGKVATGTQSRYYHLMNNKTIAPRVGTFVKQGTRLGNPSCKGGASNGIHLHFDVLYKNVYQPIDGWGISGWKVENGDREYNGYLRRAGYPTRIADTGNTASSLIISDNCGSGRYFAEYYKGRDLPSVYPAPLHRCENRVNQSWGAGGPGNGIPTNGFSARWVGVEALIAGTYTFATLTDDGVRLWVNGQKLIEFWQNQSHPITRSGTIGLDSGEFTVDMEYYENTGGAVAQLSYTRDNSTIHVIKPLHNNGKCVEIRGASMAYGAPVQQSACNRSNSAQFFYLTRREGVYEGAYYALSNFKSGQCMDVYHSDWSTEGAPIAQWPCHYYPNQQWRLQHVGGKYFQIVSRASGKCLEVPNGDDSVQLRQQTCAMTNPYQLWTVGW